MLLGADVVLRCVGGGFLFIKSGLEHHTYTENERSMYIVGERIKRAG